MHESEKWKKSLSRVRRLATPWTAAYGAGSSAHWIFQARVLEWGAIAFSVIISISNNNVIIIMEQNEACLE